MTSLLGKKRFEKPSAADTQTPGKPMLVSETDERKEIHINTAADDFADPIEN